MSVHCQSVFTGSNFARRKTSVEYPLSHQLSDVINKFPAGLRALAAQGHFSWNVIRMLSRLQLFASHGSVVNRPNTRRHTAEGDLESVETLAGLLVPSVTNDFESSLCSAAIVYTHLIHGQHQPVTSVVMCSQKELQRILPSMQWRTEAQRRCFIWMWMVSLTACMVKGVLSSQDHGLLGEFSTRFAEAAHWSSIESVLQEFFWSHTFSAAWCSSWDSKINCLRKRAGVLC
jgi:hypothetical protein